MRNIGRWMMLLFIGLMAGCDNELYRTKEGIGLIGPNGGYFSCYTETQCSGVEQ